MGKYAATAESDDKHQELDNDKACKKSVSHGSVFREQLRSRLQSLDNQTAHENGRYRFTGNTECQCRYQRTACNGIIGSFRSGNALNGAVTEIFGFRRKLAGRIITEEAGNRSTCTGEKSYNISDKPGSDDGGADLS